MILKNDERKRIQTESEHPYFPYRLSSSLVGRDRKAMAEQYLHILFTFLRKI